MPESAMLLRDEQPDDAADVRRVNEAAFGRPAEADLVKRLHGAGVPLLSYVALRAGRVVGHILFSPVSIETPPGRTALGLGPMAVLPEFHKQGIGSLLVRHGLAGCRETREPVVVVLGHARYYPRFGFVPAATRGLHCEYDVPADVFMVAELQAGALDGCSGLVRYHPEFGRI